MSITYEATNGHIIKTTTEEVVYIRTEVEAEIAKLQQAKEAVIASKTIAPEGCSEEVCVIIDNYNSIKDTEIGIIEKEIAEKLIISNTTL